MDVSLSSWFVILLAAVAANLPFFSERLFCVVPMRRVVKSLWLRLLEWLVLYFVVIGTGWLLESRIGNAFSQHWEFYAVTVAFFLVLAYPGFVFRYLRKRHG